MLFVACPLRVVTLDSLPVVAAEAGMRLGYGAALDVLNPGPEPALAKDGELDLKANSLVLRLSWGRTSMLLLGMRHGGYRRRW